MKTMKTNDEKKKPKLKSNTKDKNQDKSTRG